MLSEIGRSSAHDTAQTAAEHWLEGRKKERGRGWGESGRGEERGWMRKREGRGEGERVGEERRESE